MTRNRLPALVLLVGALVAVVALVAHGRPLGGGGSGGGPSTGFFDYAFTTIVIGFAVFAAITVWGFARKPAQGVVGQRRSSLVAMLMFWVCALLLVWVLTKGGFLRRFQKIEQALHLAKRHHPGTALGGGAHHVASHTAQLRWDEIVVALVLLAAVGIAAYVAARRRNPAPRTWRLASQAAVSAALDESLDDLRSETDLRKAIIAAYARMERALAGAGLPRRPAEAPLEYMERALGELETSAAGIRRLTDLFEWAKFSPHVPEPSMRDEAIAALVSVRDELREPRAEPVAA